jgi:hypothetical protein
MAVSRADAKSLLAIDITEVQTRALLFDAVEGNYRFLAEGASPTTVGAPVRDVSEGVRLALDQLQSISGRKLIDEDERLISPTSADGTGVDSFVATYSAGAPIKVFAVGLLDDISLESARHLVSTSFARLIGTLALNDQRKMEEQIDLIMRLRPDLIVIAGGTDNGAKRSVLNLIEPVGLACYLMGKDNTPEILYVGNQKLATEAQSMLGNLTRLHLAPNIRPNLDAEQLGPAQHQLNEVFRHILSHKVQGMQEINAWAENRVLPTGTAFGRVIRFLSKVYDPSKGVLGVNLDSSATTIAAAFAGELSLSIYPELGLSDGLPRIFKRENLASITRWLPMDIPEEEVYDFIFNRSVYPNTVPVTPIDLALDQAIVRELLRRGVAAARRSFPSDISLPRADLMPWLEPIVAGGTALTQQPTHGQLLLMLLDGLQPTGVTTVVLDQNNLSPALGAAAAANPVMTVQVLESGTFQNLGTVISPVGNARPGTPILHTRLVYDDESEITLEVKQGSLEVLTLAPGQVARLYLQPLHRYDIGMGGSGRGGSLRVVGGSLGVVVDARGRPLHLPDDSERRQEMLKKWLWVLGG